MVVDRLGVGCAVMGVLQYQVGCLARKRGLMTYMSMSRYFAQEWLRAPMHSGLMWCMALQSEFRLQKQDSQLRVIPPLSKVCTLYVRLSVIPHAPPGKTFLESRLKCQVLQYICITNQPTYDFKVKIRETDLFAAMTAGKEPGCFVDLWKSPTRMPQGSSGTAAVSLCQSIQPK